MSVAASSVGGEPIGSLPSSGSSSTVDLYAILLFEVSTNGFNALQPTSPTQYFTASGGQRAFTLADTIGALNEQMNSNTDPTTQGDTPDPLYNFQTDGDSLIMIDAMTTALYSTAQAWDVAQSYLQGAWQ